MKQSAGNRQQDDEWDDEDLEEEVNRYRTERTLDCTRGGSRLLVALFDL
jgi:hypothetical protein